MGAGARYMQELFDICAQMLDQSNKLRAAILLTLEENRHLADGEDCTLIALNHLLWSVYSAGNHQTAAKLSDQFHALRNWTFDLSEAGTLDGAAIAGFID